jgi:hypothetical protein
MSEIQNPTALSDYDWLEFEGFASKVDSEGFTYAYENYGPDFEDPSMQALAEDMGKLRAYHRENAHLVDEWWAKVGGERGCDLHNAHVDENRKRRQDACLWGIRCTDGYIITEQSEQDRSRTVAYLQASPGKGRRQASALLHRTVAGGAWTENLLS